MNIKSLLLGSAAVLAGAAGAQAADPVKAVSMPMNYVEICDAFGSNYFYIPGTETCLKIGGYVRFQVSFDEDSWDANTKADLQVTAKTDTELGELTGFYEVIAETDDDMYLDAAYLSLGGFKAGKYGGIWDAGIVGEVDDLHGGASFDNIAYSFGGEGFSAAVELDELYGGDELGIGAMVGFSMGGIGFDVAGVYDFNAEEGAVRGIFSADAGPGTFEVGAVYYSGMSAYADADVDWAVAVGYKLKATDKLTITPAYQYTASDSIDDDWKVGVLFDYAVTDGLAAKLNLDYTDSSDEVSGWFRLQRSF